MTTVVAVSWVVYVWLAAGSREASTTARARAVASWWGVKSLRQQRPLTQRLTLVRPLMAAAPDSGEPHSPPTPEGLLRQLMPDVPVNMPISAEAMVPISSGNGNGLAQHSSSQQHDILVQDILSLPPDCVDVMPPPPVLEPAARPAEQEDDEYRGGGDSFYTPRPLKPEEVRESRQGEGGGRRDWWAEEGEWVGGGCVQTNYFVEMLRNSASYISMHRGSTMVLHLPGDLIGTAAFEKTLDDIALMSLLGVKIVLVCGVATQVGTRCGISLRWQVRAAAKLLLSWY